MDTGLLLGAVKWFWNYKVNILKVTDLFRKRKKKNKYHTGILLSHEKG